MLKNKETESSLSLLYDIDIEVCETQFVYTDNWKEKIRQGIPEDELVMAQNCLNNVIKDVRILIQIHKPGRVDKKEIQGVINS